MGLCPGDEVRGATPSEVPRAPLRAQPRRADHGARRGGRALVRAPWRQGHLARRASIAKPDITLAFKNAAIGASLLTPPINWLDQINAQKDFNLTVDGPEDLTNWWAQTMMATMTAGWQFGTRLADGTMRYCNMTNGGPVFVYVKDGRIVRMTPIDFDDTDPQPWTISARGMKFTPPRKTTLAPHGQNAKSIVYSPDRLLHPMKRVDFDPDGARNPQNRGKSGYVRISWDEALDIVSSEIKRLQEHVTVPA